MYRCHQQRELDSHQVFRAKSKSKLCYDRRSVGQSVLVSSTHLGLTTRFLLLSDSCGFVDVGCSLWRENGSAIYNCAGSCQRSHSWVLSPAGLVTIFYYLGFENPPTWKARSPYLYPTGTGWPSYTPRHWVPFSSPGYLGRQSESLYIPSARKRGKQRFEQFLQFCLRMLLSDGPGIVAYLHSSSVPMSFSLLPSF
jgi:hypothetical protein